ncbi:3228_t:CDS:1, partial [Gigaspora rosea]
LLDFLEVFVILMFTFLHGASYSSVYLLGSGYQYLTKSMFYFFYSSQLIISKTGLLIELIYLIVVFY